jgi:hypothetical protein
MKAWLPDNVQVFCIKWFTLSHPSTLAKEERRLSVLENAARFTDAITISSYGKSILFYLFFFFWQSDADDIISVNYQWSEVTTNRWCFGNCRTYATTLTPHQLIRNRIHLYKLHNRNWTWRCHRFIFTHIFSINIYLSGITNVMVNVNVRVCTCRTSMSPFKNG